METIARSREENDDSIHAERGDSANSGWRKLEDMPEYSSPDAAKKSDAETSTDEKSELNDDGGSFGMMNFDDISSISVPDVAKKPEDSGKGDGGDEKLLDGMEFLPFPPAASGKPEGGSDAAKKPEAGAGPDAGKKPNKYSMLVDSEGKFTDAFTLSQPEHYERADPKIEEKFKEYRFKTMGEHPRKDNEAFTDYTKRLESEGMMNDIKTYAESFGESATMIPDTELGNRFKQQKQEFMARNPKGGNESPADYFQRLKGLGMIIDYADYEKYTDSIGESITPIPDTDLGKRFKAQREEYMKRYPQEHDESQIDYIKRLRGLGLIVNFADYEKTHPDEVSDSALKSVDGGAPDVKTPAPGSVDPKAPGSFDSLTPEEQKKYTDFEYFISIKPERMNMAKAFGINEPKDVYKLTLDQIDDIKQKIEASEAAELRKALAEANVLRTELLSKYKVKLEKRGIFYEQLKTMTVDELKALRQEMEAATKLINSLFTNYAKMIAAKGLDRSKMEAMKSDELKVLESEFKAARAAESGTDSSSSGELSDAEKAEAEKKNKLINRLMANYAKELADRGLKRSTLKTKEYDELEALENEFKAARAAESGTDSSSSGELSDAEKAEAEKKNKLINHLMVNYAKELADKGLKRSTLKTKEYDELEALENEFKAARAAKSGSESSSSSEKSDKSPDKKTTDDARTEKESDKEKEVEAKKEWVNKFFRRRHCFLIVRKYTEKELLRKTQEDLDKLDKEAADFETDMEDVFTRGQYDPAMKAFFEKRGISNVNDLARFRADHPYKYKAEVGRFKKRMEIAVQKAEKLGREANAQMVWQVYGDALIGLGVKNVSELYGLSKDDYKALVDQAAKEDEEKDALIAKIVSDPANDGLNYTVLKQSKIEDLREKAKNAKVDPEKEKARKLYAKKERILSKYSVLLGDDPEARVRGIYDEGELDKFEKDLEFDDRRMNRWYATIMRVPAVSDKYSIFSLESFKGGIPSVEKTNITVEAELADPDMAKRRGELLRTLRLKHMDKIAADGYEYADLNRMPADVLRDFVIGYDKMDADAAAKSSA